MQKLLAGGQHAFGNFPIDRDDLARKTVSSLFTKDAICRALTPSIEANEGNHNKLREEAKTGRLSAEAALKRGMKAARVPLSVRCQEGYDWENSPEFNGADECDDVTSTFGKGMAVTLFSTPMSPSMAQDALADHSQSPLYTAYPKGSPIACGAGPGYDDSFNRIEVSALVPDIEFAMRSYRGVDWLAWTLRKSCLAPGGKKYSSDDLMFDHGVYAFVPVRATIDGDEIDDTLVIGQIAAASTSAFAGIVPDSIAFERTCGGMYAKKLFLDAKSQGWKLEK